MGRRVEITRLILIYNMAVPLTGPLKWTWLRLTSIFQPLFRILRERIIAFYFRLKYEQLNTKNFFRRKFDIIIK